MEDGEGAMQGGADVLKQQTQINTDLVSLVDQQKLFEFRRASILFVNLPGIDYGADSAAVLCTLQHALVSMQEILVDLEGSLRQFIMDDKGTTLIGVFGLYPGELLLFCFGYFFFFFFLVSTIKIMYADLCSNLTSIQTCSWDTLFFFFFSFFIFFY